MTRTRPGSAARWALALVASLQFLTWPGTWLVTDQAESLFTARRLLDHGTLRLAEPGAVRIPELPWARGRAGEPIRSRLLPGTAVTLVPLLWLDRLVGTESAVDYGRLVHLQGPLFGLGSLALLAFSLRRAGGDSESAAFAVSLVGLSWPFWTTARRGGPEPILGLLMLAYVAAGPAAGSLRAGRLLRVAACLLLPWVHPTGSVVALVLAATTFALSARRPGGSGERPWAELLAAVLGSASVVLAWNGLYHGHWWAGGYALVGGEAFFGATSPAAGLSAQLRSLALEAPLLVAAGLLGARAGGAEGRRRLAPAAAVLVALLAMFATYYRQEPTRRLSVVWPAWGLAVAAAWPPVRARRHGPQLAIALAGVLGFHGFWQAESAYYPGPGGLFYPSVLWVKAAIDGEVWGCAALLLGFAACCGASAGLGVALRERRGRPPLEH